jgi:thiamine kinase-like enzyme
MQQGENGLLKPLRLLLRVYGVGMESYISRENEMNWLQRLSALGYAPRLLGTFANGRFEEYLDAKTCSAPELRDPSISRAIARQLARLHALHQEKNLNEHQGCDVARVENMNAAKTCLTIDEAQTWCTINVFMERARRGSEGRVDAPDFCVLERLLEQYRMAARQVCSPLVFAHNDTQYGNVMYTSTVSKCGGGSSQGGSNSNIYADTSIPKVFIIDYEYSSVSPRGFDIANHFAEWMADYHGSEPHVLDESRYPTLAERTLFYEAYSCKNNSIQKARGGLVRNYDADTERLEAEVRFYLPCSHLFWGLWGLVRDADTRNRREIDFDYWSYGLARIAAFIRHDITQLQRK